MSQQEFLNQLADIDIPTAVDNSTHILITSSGIGVITCLVICYVLWRKNTQRKKTITPTHNALERLNQLEQQWQQGNIDSRYTAYQLATLLRLSLDLEQLSVTHFSDTQWQKTVTLLQELRYNKSAQNKLSAQTFILVRQWLTQANRSHA